MRELKERVSSNENTITFKECHLDGKFVPVQRVRSEPEVFEVEIDKDNAYNIQEEEWPTPSRMGIGYF